MPALILMYHDIADDICDVAPGHRPYVLAPSVFSRQMQLISASGMPVPTVTEWVTIARPPRAAIVTFDDGHVSNYEVVLPILQARRLKATFFITAGSVGTGSTMNWRQLRAMHAAGMEIGSHTVTHRAPVTLDDEGLRYELVESRRILEDGLGAPVTSVSSPTGFFNPRMHVLAREAGYRALCFGRAGFAAQTGDQFALERVAIKRNIGEKQFDALLRFDVATICRLRCAQVARGLARTALGPDAYLRIRRALLPASQAR